MAHPLEPPRFEKATLADVEALVEVHALAFAQDEIQNGKGPVGFKNPNWHQTRIQQDCYHKILIGEQIAGGVVVLDKGEGRYFLDTLFVGPNFQNLGLGQRAMEFLEQNFPQAKHWSLVTPHKSYRNHHFYAKFGFEKTGERFMGDQPGFAPDFTLWIYEKQRG